MQRSLFRQGLWAEYACLRATCPEGVYVTVAPGDPSRWTGVLFIRQGPYAPAILRFQFLFLDDYPASPPLITFFTDIFHPLVNSLTTYTYTTGASDGDVGSSAEHETLPPGGFSLRHGFPHWFSRERGRGRSKATSGSNAASRQSSHPDPSGSASAVTVGQVSGESDDAASGERDVPVLALLEYIRSAFTDAALLDSIPLDAAANQGAYHAWRSYRAHKSGDERSSSSRVGHVSGSKARRPGEWNWEGVWEERVKKGVRASLSEQVLFGGAVASDDLIRFADLDDDMGDAVKQLISHVTSGQGRQVTAE